MIFLLRKRELIILINCVVAVSDLCGFLAGLRVGLRYVIVTFQCQTILLLRFYSYDCVIHNLKPSAF